MGQAKTADRLRPTFELESAELQLGAGPIAGVDEAGRGPWAGPVVAAAVILDPDALPNGIDDSKALDEDRRETLFCKLCDQASISVAIADVARIDRDNILAATMWAMAEAVAGLSDPGRNAHQLENRVQPGIPPRLALIDGNRAPPLDCETRTIIKGDARCLSIAAASIVAKVTRDRLMVRLAKEYPGYGFERHKGYGTAEHRAAIDRLGVTDQHRRSFKPIQLALGLTPQR